MVDSRFPQPHNIMLGLRLNTMIGCENMEIVFLNYGPYFLDFCVGLSENE